MDDMHGLRPKGLRSNQIKNVKRAFCAHNLEESNSVVFMAIHAKLNVLWQKYKRTKKLRFWP